MAVTAPVLAGKTLAVPTTYSKDRTWRGGRQIMADGTMVTDLVSVTAKRSWELGWELITEAEYNNLRDAFDLLKEGANAADNFTDIDAAQYTVTLGEDYDTLPAKLRKIAGGVRYDTSIKLRQV